MVILNCHQVIQCTMNRIILAGFNLDRQNTHSVAVVNKEVYLSFLLIVVVEQFFVMCFQFLSNSAFIDRAKVNAGNVVQYWLNIIMIPTSFMYSFNKLFCWDSAKGYFGLLIAWDGIVIPELIRYSNSST